jgi:hypothetical protein
VILRAVLHVHANLVHNCNLKRSRNTFTIKALPAGINVGDGVGDSLGDGIGWAVGEAVGETVGDGIGDAV